MANTSKPLRKRVKRAAARGERLLIMDEVWTMSQSSRAARDSTLTSAQRAWRARTPDVVRFDPKAGGYQELIKQLGGTVIPMRSGDDIDVGTLGKGKASLLQVVPASKLAHDVKN